jgi:hypothetical protein
MAPAVDFAASAHLQLADCSLVRTGARNSSPAPSPFSHRNTEPRSSPKGQRPAESPSTDLPGRSETGVWGPVIGVGEDDTRAGHTFARDDVTVGVHHSSPGPSATVGTLPRCRPANRNRLCASSRTSWSITSITSRWAACARTTIGITPSRSSHALLIASATSRDHMHRSGE